MKIDYDIIDKAVNGTLTSAEEELFIEWLSSDVRHRQFYHSYLGGGQSNPYSGLSDEELSKAKGELMAKLGFESSAVDAGEVVDARLPLFKPTVWQRAAKSKPMGWVAKSKPMKWAAIILLGIVVQTTAYYLFFREKPMTGLESALSIVVPQIEPGENKAYLFLEDGERITLDRESDGLIKEGETTILAEESQLVYKSKGESISEEAVENQLFIPRGGEFTLVLSDGTKVWLNSESYIKYPVKFVGKTREVTLIGEAYFEIAEDSDRPFIVKTADFRAKVIGTSFNINSYRDNNHSDIVVASGIVDLIRPSGETTRVIRNQQLLIDRESDTQTVNSVNSFAYTAWKDGLFYFEREPLSTIAERLSRWYDTEIEITSPTLSETRFSGLIQKYTDADQVFEMLALTGELEYTIKKVDGACTISINRK